MNILVIHEVDWLKKVVYEVHDIPELLSLRGHAVTVIDYEEHWRREHPLDLLRLTTQVFEGASRAFDGSHIELRRPGLVKLPLLDRLSSLPVQFQEIRRTIERNRIDLVFLYAMPTSGLSAIWLAKRAGIPVVFRAIDVLHDLRKGIVSQAIRAAEQIAYPAVDRIVALTPQMREYVCGLGARAENVDVLLPGIDCARFRPQPKDPALLSRYGLSASDKVVLFMGTLYDFAGLDFMIDRFAEVKAAVPEARFVLVGGAGVEHELRARAASTSPGDAIVFTGAIDYPELPAHLNLADITINSFRDVAVTRNVFPGKIPQYMACGKPLLATPLRGVAQVLSGERDGVVFSPLGDDFIAALIDLLRDDARRARLGAASLAYVERNHSWDATITNLVSLFEGVVQRSRDAQKAAN